MYIRSDGYEAAPEDSEPDFEDGKVSAGGLERKVNTVDSRGENGAINEPAFVYVPVIEGEKGYHVLDMARTQQLNPGWGKKAIREIIRVRKIKQIRVFPDFDYKDYAAKKAVNMQDQAT